MRKLLALSLLVAQLAAAQDFFCGGGAAVNNASISPSVVTTSFVDAGTVWAQTSHSTTEVVDGALTAGTITSGTTMASGTTLRFGTQLLNGNSQVVLTASQLGFSDTDILGNTTNVAGQTGIAAINITSLTRGMDRYIVRLWPDNFGTVAASLTTNGTWLNAATVGTAASGTGVTASYSGAGPYWLHKVVVTFAAMTAAATTDINVVVATPANSAIRRVKADVTTQFTGGALTAVTLTCGNAAGGNQYLLSGNVFAAPIVLGDVAGEVGAGLLTATWADFGTAAAGTNGAIAVSCRFTCTTANCNAATGGSATFYVEGVTYF